MSTLDPFLQTRIAFIGGGNMARAMIGGLLDSGCPPSSFAVGESHPGQRSALVPLGVTVTDDNAAALSGARVAVLAVKPQDAAAALRPLRAQLGAGKPLLLSVAAGLRVTDLRAWCGPGVPVVRAMPNRPAFVRAGASALFATPEVTPDDRMLAAAILGAVGSVAWVASEAELDVVTALSGSGPAYFFLLAELLADAAVALGLEPAVASDLAIGTLHGAGVLAQESDGDLARLRAEVTSRGGTTEAALRAFDAAGLRSIVATAVAAAATRSRELAAHYGASGEPGSTP